MTIVKKILQFAQFDPNILIQNKLFQEDLDFEIQPPITPDPYLNPVKIVHKKCGNLFNCTFDSRGYGWSYMKNEQMLWYDCWFY